MDTSRMQTIEASTVVRRVYRLSRNLWSGKERVYSDPNNHGLYYDVHIIPIASYINDTKDMLKYMDRSFSHLLGQIKKMVNTTRSGLSNLWTLSDVHLTEIGDTCPYVSVYGEISMGAFPVHNVSALFLAAYYAIHFYSDLISAKKRCLQIMWSDGGH